MAVPKEVIFNKFHFGGCSSHVRANPVQFCLWDGVVVLKDWLWTIITLGGCG